MPTTPGREGEALVSHPSSEPSETSSLWVRQVIQGSVCVCVCVCVCARTCAIAQSCMTLHHPMYCSPPGSPIHGTSQARILEWFAISSSRGSSQPRDQTRICCLAGRFFTMGRNFKAHRGFLTSLTKWTSAKLDYCLLEFEHAFAVQVKCKLPSSCGTLSHPPLHLC